MTETTTRWALPLLAAGQAQKEMTHNEALATLDLLVQAAVEAVGMNVPPAAPMPGGCWIVGTAPTGEWTGHAGVLAGWTEAGWRFAIPREGMAVWSIADAAWVRRTGGAWRTGVRATVAEPVGGTTVDLEARAALGAVIAALWGHGLLAG